MTKTVHLILSSTRQKRLGEPLSHWLKSHLEKTHNLKLEIIDLAKEDLPFFDSAISPATAPVSTPAGKAWASKISQTDRIIFLTPEYNRSIPAALKNAIDYLSAEWKDKPAAIISYGYVDGGKSSSSHLRDILSWLKAKITDNSVNIILSREMFDQDGSLINLDASLSDYKPGIKQTVSQLLS